LSIRGRKGTVFVSSSTQGLGSGKKKRGKSPFPNTREGKGESLLTYLNRYCRGENRGGGEKERGEGGHFHGGKGIRGGTRNTFLPDGSMAEGRGAVINSSGK